MVNSIYRKNMGDCFCKQNNQVKAIEHYSIACHVDPEDEQAFFKLATCQSEYGQHLSAASSEAESMLQQAISNYRNVINLDKNNAFAWNNIAYIYLYKNKTGGFCFDFVLIILPLIAVAIAVVLLVNDTKKKNEMNIATSKIANAYEKIIIENKMLIGIINELSLDVLENLVDKYINNKKVFTNLF